jgi:glyoxylase-like metal-dependent hydrolase (beta-lactamase superfamily II)
MKITVLHAGYCIAPEHIAIQDGAWRNIQFPAMFALLEHPRFGPMLFDSGYSYRFFDATKSFPNLFYRWTTPVTLREEDLAVNQLSIFNIKPSDISRVFISHFHADHIAALADFDRARYIYLPHAYDNIRHTRGLQAVSKAFLPGLIPGDFDERSAAIDVSTSRALPPQYAPFTKGYDLLGDESILAVELPGHAHGQMGLFVRDDHKTYFFVADAAWLKQSIEENRPPHKIADLLFSDGKAYRETLGNLHEYHMHRPEVNIIPSHCKETITSFSPNPEGVI